MVASESDQSRDWIAFDHTGRVVGRGRQVVVRGDGYVESLYNGDRGALPRNTAAAKSQHPELIVNQNLLLATRPYIQFGRRWLLSAVALRQSIAGGEQKKSWLEVVVSGWAVEAVGLGKAIRNVSRYRQRS